MKNNLWVAGGYTGGGVTEAVMDHPAKGDIVRCNFTYVLTNGDC
jgi:hypothetical protein